VNNETFDPICTGSGRSLGDRTGPTTHGRAGPRWRGSRRQRILVQRRYPTKRLHAPGAGSEPRTGPRIGTVPIGLTAAAPGQCSAGPDACVHELPPHPGDSGRFADQRDHPVAAVSPGWGSSVFASRWRPKRRPRTANNTKPRKITVVRQVKTAYYSLDSDQLALERSTAKQARDPSSSYSCRIPPAGSCPIIPRRCSPISLHIELWVWPPIQQLFQANSCRFWFAPPSQP
jgi:hypothetical protein